MRELPVEDTAAAVIRFESGILAATLANAESATAGRPIRIDEMLERRKSWGRNEEPDRP